MATDYSRTKPPDIPKNLAITSSNPVMGPVSWTEVGGPAVRTYFAWDATMGLI